MVGDLGQPLSVCSVDVAVPELPVPRGNLLDGLDLGMESDSRTADRIVNLNETSVPGEGVPVIAMSSAVAVNVPDDALLLRHSDAKKRPGGFNPRALCGRLASL